MLGALMDALFMLLLEPTFGRITEKGYFEMTVQDYWGHIYVHNFIWECFHGLLKDGQKIKHINKKCEDNRLMNLTLRSSNVKTSYVYLEWSVSTKFALITDYVI